MDEHSHSWFFPGHTPPPTCSECGHVMTEEEHRAADDALSLELRQIGTEFLRDIGDVFLEDGT